MDQNYEVDIRARDGSGWQITCFEREAVQDLLEEYRDKPVRVWVDGQMVQRGFIADDERDAG